MSEHPCPVPELKKRNLSDGELWACRCGVVYRLTYEFDYWRAHWRDEWTWIKTNLTAEVKS